MQPTEIWKSIPNHEGYEVSNLGRVRSYRGLGLSKELVAVPRMLRPSPSVRGRYLQVSLFGSKRYVHDLVATAFLGPRPEGMDVAHWDNDGHNNAATNLRYATAAENMADKLRHGTHNRGERCGTHKLSAAQVAEIRERYGPYVRYGRGLETQRSLAAEYGVTWQQIGTIVRGEAWEYAA